MQIGDFIWLPDIVDKLAIKHNVTQDEAEDVFFNHPHTALLNRGIDLVKTCTLLQAKRMQAGS